MSHLLHAESLGLQRHELEKFLADHLVPYTFVRGEFTPNPTSPIIKVYAGLALMKAFGQNLVPVINVRTDFCICMRVVWYGMTCEEVTDE